MNKAFKKRQISFLVQILLISIALFGLHNYLLFYFGKEISLFFPIWHIYIFHLIITTILYTLINYRYSTGRMNVFNLFMGATFLKMIIAILFLLPLLLSDFENKQPDVFNFFIPYFFKFRKVNYSKTDCKNCLFSLTYRDFHRYWKFHFQ